VDMGNFHYTGTVRDVVFTSVGGNTVRVRLTNTFGSQPYEFGDASVGVSDSQGNLTGPIVPLTFSGQRSVTLPQGAEVVSDPVSLTVPPLHDLAVSVYVPHDDGEQSGHPAAQQVNYVTQGTDNVMDRTTAAYGLLGQWFYVDGVDVTTQPTVKGTVVTLGDSITDGIQSTVNANKRWPNDLARRLSAHPGVTMSVADEGISGNQILQDEGGAGVSALHRFQRDVVGQTGAEDVILLEGINDIGSSDAQASQIIAGDEQLIAQAHAAGLKIFGGTVTPFKGAFYWSPEKEQTRDAVNNWIRTSGAFDGVIDFASATADPSDPEVFYPAYDSGDHLHPSDVGYQAMANAVNLGILLHPMSQTTPPVTLSVNPATVSAGQEITVNGTGFGATQDSGYVDFSDNGIDWGAPGNPPVQVDSWSDTAITFTVPTASGTNGELHVYPGTTAAMTVVNSDGAASGSAFAHITPTANPSDYYDNISTSPDSNQACANSDGVGFSYSATALADAGLTPGAMVTADGLTFTWPDVAPCSPDNFLAAGQTMLVNGKTGQTTLGLLGYSTNGGSQGSIVINYTDGTSSTQTLSFNDWAGGPGNGDTAVATMPYRNSVSGSSQTLAMYVFATTVQVDPSKTVASIVFPDVSNHVGVTAMHIFAIALGS
jgi:lysophospholipase L1-like esterase